MDYNSIHGQDVTNFSSPSQHRMPTKSAAQALQDLQNPIIHSISTGVPDLDLAIQNKNLGADEDGTGGLKRGTVTEIYGPPGVGKTTLGLQIAANALRSGSEVVWLDCANSVSGPRLRDILSSNATARSSQGHTTPQDLKVSTTKVIDDKPTSDNVGDLAKRLSHFITPSLPRLIALLCHPTPAFPAEDTALIIVDSLSSLIIAAYPRTQENPSTPQKPGLNSKNDPARIAAARKWPVLQYILTSLKKLAMLRNIAIVMLNHTVTKMQPGDGAILVPAISSDAWEAGLTTRIVLFRDWGRDNQNIHFASVTRAVGNGIGNRDGLGRLVAMSLDKDGFRGVKLADAVPRTTNVIPQILTRKRKVNEIMDSEDEGDEDYGWEDGEELPPPPPQWQGSEDILVPGPGEDGQEEEDEDEDPNALDEAEVNLSDGTN